MWVAGYSSCSSLCAVRCFPQRSNSQHLARRKPRHARQPGRGAVHVAAPRRRAAGRWLRTGEVLMAAARAPRLPHRHAWCAKSSESRPGDTRGSPVRRGSRPASNRYRCAGSVGSCSGDGRLRNAMSRWFHSRPRSPNRIGAVTSARRFAPIMLAAGLSGMRFARAPRLNPRPYSALAARGWSRELRSRLPARDCGCSHGRWDAAGHFSTGFGERCTDTQPKGPPLGRWIAMNLGLDSPLERSTSCSHSIHQRGTTEGPTTPICSHQDNERR